MAKQLKIDVKLIAKLFEIYYTALGLPISACTDGKAKILQETSWPYW
jgi:hypothetical protein